MEQFSSHLWMGSHGCRRWMRHESWCPIFQCNCVGLSEPRRTLRLPLGREVWWYSFHAMAEIFRWDAQKLRSYDYKAFVYVHCMNGEVWQLGMLDSSFMQLSSSCQGSEHENGTIQLSQSRHVLIGMEPRYTMPGHPVAASP